MMKIVLLTALGVGGATIFGSLIGFVFRNISHKFSDIVLSFAAGVMLSAAVLGLILPSLNYGGTHGILVSIIGIFTGAVCLNLIDKLVPHLHKLVGTDTETHRSTNLDKVLLLSQPSRSITCRRGLPPVSALEVKTRAQAMMIAFGIALQNIPEGMVIIAPMLAAGVSPVKTFVCAMVTGLIEVVGTLLGYWAVSIASAILPFALAFAGGTMLYVISDEMIPETHAHGSETGATYALLAGFCVMLVSDFFLG